MLSVSLSSLARGFSHTPLRSALRPSLVHTLRRHTSSATAASATTTNTNTNTNNNNNIGRVSAAVVQSQEQVSGKKVEKKVDFSLSPPKGTRDFYPEDLRLRNWLFDLWRETAGKFGFEEYDAPVVEHAELYIRKAGEEVTQQLYDFYDKGERHLSLRPEMTPSLARMVLARRGALTLPLKWFAVPQCWRYERMTRGRRREHFQWNMDIFGVEGVEAEAELLSAIVTSFQAMGLSASDVGIKINSRELLNDLMQRVGISADKWVPTCVLVDKLDKVELHSLSKEVESLGIPMEVMQELVNLLQMKTLEDYINVLGEDATGVQSMKRLFKLLEAYQITDWCEFDPTVVRGLAYYTGIVFEGFDRRKELRAICGGGRYDKLIESFGGDALPAVGFGFGDAVIMELLKARNLLPNKSMPKVDVVAYAMQENLRGKLLSVVRDLRAAKIKVDVILGDKKPKWAFQRADRIGAPFLLMAAEDEDKVGQVTLKNMRTSTQDKIAYADVVGDVLTRLKSIENNAV